ncbi:MAG: DUF5050 domain-containing protein [candidate division Zixibacteria bacterium]|nr:DUF5050 domain-containing protein [candidate division Zixibacteria bacterium]
MLTISWKVSTARNGPFFCQELSWSPDGKRIAFSARTEKEPFEIYVVNADGSGLKQLTNDSSEDYWTSWSPDGKKIAFNSNRDGNYEIYIMDADGSNPTRLTNHAEKDIGPSFSPDGKKIAFTSVRDGNYELYVMNVNGTGLKRLTNTPHKEYNPIWSPDGKRLVYYYEKGDRKDQIYICNADGSNPRNITNNEANNIFPAWMAGGKEIIFTSNPNRVEGIYSIKPDGSGLKSVKTGERRAFFARYSPDGSKLAVITGGWPSSNITIINADGSNPIPVQLAGTDEYKQLMVVREFAQARAGGDNIRALSYLADTCRIWFEKKEGPGRPWKMDGPWAHWDEFFHSKQTYRDWKSEGNAVSAIIDETNDYYRLLDWEPAPVLLTWWLDGNDKIAGYLVKGLEEGPAKNRMEEFKEWAQKNHPEELAYLLPEGKINPDGDRPERWRKILVEWRKAAGLKPVLLSD